VQRDGDAGAVAPRKEAMTPKLRARGDACQRLGDRTQRDGGELARHPPFAARLDLHRLVHQMKIERRDAGRREAQGVTRLHARVQRHLIGLHVVLASTAAAALWLRGLRGGRARRLGPRRLRCQPRRRVRSSGAWPAGDSDRDFSSFIIAKA
jgi:hypothetical protein